MDNCTCAHGAAFYKNVDVLEMLVAKKIDVNIKDISGKNILHLLCKDSLDENTPSGSSSSSSSSAAAIIEATSQAQRDTELAERSKRLVKLVGRLIDELHMNVDEKDSNEFTPFMYACEHENLDLLQTLIDHKANIEFTSGEGINGMLLAIVNSCTKVAKKLIESGFNVKTSSALLNCSYITDAAYLNDIEILRVLIDAGCDINETKVIFTIS
jgi:ankyrin repeat protein